MSEARTEPARRAGVPDADVDEQAVVHLRLRGVVGEEELTGLRQQLAACLSSGVTDLRVHAHDQDDLDVAVLQALAGVAQHLARRGGSLHLVGASPRVRRRLRVHELEHLLPRRAKRPATS